MPTRHSSIFRDHPRVCGEHIPQIPCVTHGAGSSPRMRGTHRISTLSVGRRGIIPAYAGNTMDPACIPGVLRDHPRVCGEHIDAEPVAKRRKGSSPRMRGTRPSARPCAHYCGIIPAYAGNTAHPFHGGYRRPGSSPRMRGTPDLHNKSVVCIGIIPAYAGNTTPLSRP